MDEEANVMELENAEAMEEASPSDVSNNNCTPTLPAALPVTQISMSATTTATTGTALSLDPVKKALARNAEAVELAVPTVMLSEAANTGSKKPLWVC